MSWSTKKKNTVKKSIHESDLQMKYYNILNSIQLPFHKSKYPFDAYKTGNELELLASKCMLFNAPNNHGNNNHKNNNFRGRGEKNSSDQPAFVIQKRDGDVFISAGGFFVFTP